MNYTITAANINPLSSYHHPYALFAQAYIELLMMEIFTRTVADMKTSPAVRTVMRDLLLLHILHRMIACGGEMLEVCMVTSTFSLSFTCYI